MTHPPAGPVTPSPPPGPRQDPPGLTLTRVNPYRIDAHLGDRLLAYAIADSCGWAVMRRRNGRIRTVARVDYGTTARRNARIAERLITAALTA